MHESVARIQLVSAGGLASSRVTRARKSCRLRARSWKPRSVALSWPVHALHACGPPRGSGQYQENRSPQAARGPVAAVRRALASGGAQCARTREDTQLSISDCSQATARVDSLIGTGNWFCEMSL